MSGKITPRRPKTEAELLDAQSNIESLKQDLLLCEGNPSAKNLLENWLRQQETKADNRRRQLNEADAFAASLRRVRERRNLTQVELAKRAGVGQAMVSLLEQGDRQPSWSTVCRLAKALDIGIEEFQKA